jgi:hypothetical protein
MARTAMKAEEIMTDFQFRALVKMILGYVAETEDVEKIKKYLSNLIAEEAADASEAKSRQREE